MSKKTFRKFNSLENHYRDKFINAMMTQGKDAGEWVITEKVHGANFSFWFDGGADVWMGKRSGIVGDNFYSSYKLNKYHPAVEITYENLLEAGLLEVGDVMVIYGEIFGGNFFGEKEADSKKVQTGVDYHPGTEFAAFDIQVITLDEERPNYILSYEQMVELIHDEIPRCPELKRGEFYDLIAEENDFPSRVPSMFGLEVPEGKHAQCEGFVLRPVDGEKFLNNGSRCIIKSKNAKYSEKGGAKQNPGGKAKDSKFNDEETALYQSFSVYFTQSRLESVVSKIGEVTWQDFGKLNGLLIQDAMEDYNRDNDCSIKEGDFWAKAKKPIGSLAGEIVREYLKRTV